MALTTHGIKMLGFKEMEENKNIECKFYFVLIFSVKGLKFLDIPSDRMKELVYKGR